MVSRCYHKIRVDRLLRYFGMLYSQTMVFRNLGKTFSVLRQKIQIKWYRKCILPNVCIQESPIMLKITCWRICSISSLGNKIRKLRSCRTYRYKANQWNNYVSSLFQLDKKPSWFTIKVESMDKYCKMVVQASNSIHQNKRVSLARRTYRTCNFWGSQCLDVYQSLILCPNI